jgi:hypothetical protein
MIRHSRCATGQPFRRRRSARRGFMNTISSIFVNMKLGNLKSAILIAAALFAAPPVSTAQPVQGMVELVCQGRKIEGAPLSWDEQTIHLLGRDGCLWKVETAEVRSFKQTVNYFHAYSPSEIRAALLIELGGDYEVSGTSHYLVAHPAGQGDRWAERFEQLYRSFVSYLSLRGFRCAPPPYPLIGIVCQNQREFEQYAAKTGLSAPNGALGYYALESNRITLYDMGAAVNAANWRENASVVIHEAAHQTAFNTGVHSRYCPPPTWLAEGLATMFEAPGIYDAHRYPQLADRINRGRLNDFRSYVESRHKPELIQSIVASDRIFSVNSTAAYAEAWALTFYLIENEPRKYAQYLALTAGRPAFSDCDAAQRVADFTAVFGSNWRMMEAQFLRFMKTIK